MKARFFGFLLAGLVAAAPALAQSVQNIVLRNSFSPTGAGARGQGMGGAFIGVADDGTAASFNPAGLAQLRRSEIAAVGFWDELSTTRSGGAGQGELRETSRHEAPDFFGLAVPFTLAERNLTVQLSYQRAVDLFGKGSASTRDSIPFRDLLIPLPGNADVRGEIAPQQSGAFRTISLSGAYQLTPRLSFGLSFNYWFADWTAQGRTVFAILTSTTPPVLIRADTRAFEQKQGLHAVSVNSGLLLKYSWLSVGGVLRLPFSGRYELEETGSYTAAVAGRATTTVPVSSYATTKLDWPMTGGIGIALRPLPGLTLAGDAAKSYWSRATLRDLPDGALLTPAPEAVDGVEPTPTYNDRNFFDLNPASVTLTSDTKQLRAGVEYLLTVPKVVIPLRGGVFRDESPVRDLSNDRARRIEGWTVGSGLNFSRFVLDVAFERRSAEAVVGLQVRRGQGASASNTEKVREDRIVASLILRLGADDPIKRGLKKLFVGGEEKPEN